MDVESEYVDKGTRASNGPLVCFCNLLPGCAQNSLRVRTNIKQAMQLAVLI